MKLAARMGKGFRFLNRDLGAECHLHSETPYAIFSIYCGTPPEAILNHHLKCATKL